MVKIKLKNNSFSTGDVVVSGNRDGGSGNGSGTEKNRKKLKVKIKPPSDDNGSTPTGIANSAAAATTAATTTATATTMTAGAGTGTNIGTTSAADAQKKRKTRTIKLNPSKTIRFKLNQNSKNQLAVGKKSKNGSAGNNGGSSGGNGNNLPKIKVMPKIRFNILGDGYDSEAPDKENEPLLEEGIILRLMNDPELDYVKQCVDSGDLSGISIRWKDSKRAAININHSFYLGKLVDLPTIIESHKSVDKKNIFKTIDICQMLYVFRKITPEEYDIFVNHKLNEDDDDEDDDGDDETKPKKNSSSASNDYNQEVLRIIYDWFKQVDEYHSDGLAPPMTNVRKTRFRPTLNVRHIETIEKRVQDLLDADEAAETVQLELMNESDYNMNHGFPAFAHTPTSSFSHQIASTPAGTDNFSSPQPGGVEDEAAEEIMEEDEEEEFEIEGDEDLDKFLENFQNTSDQENNEGHNGEEREVEVEGVIDEGQDEEEEDDDEDDDDEEDEEEEDNDNDDDGDNEEDGEAKQHNRILKEEIAELESTIKDKEKKCKSIHNQILRGRVIGTIQKLKHELEMKKRQLKTEEDKEEKKKNDKKAESRGDDYFDEDGDNENAGDEDEDEEMEDEEADDEDDEPAAGSAGATKNSANNGTPSANTGNAGVGEDEDEDDDDASLDDLF